MLHHRFEDQVRRAPDHIAVITETSRLSYRQLDARANRLAAHLGGSGGPPAARSTVAICLDRLPDTLVAILAVLKAGHAYTVVAPRLPGEAIRRLMLLADADAVITHQAQLPRIDDGAGRPAVCLDSDAEAIGARSGTAPEDRPAGPRASVLFSAGTTGAHTAVECTHERLLAAYRAWSGICALSSQDRLLITARPGTTEFTGGWIRALCSGATLVLAGDPAAVADMLEDITVVEADPVTAARLLKRELPALRLVTVVGEPLRLSAHRRLQHLGTAGARVLSVYGPPEVGGCGTWFEPGQPPGPVPLRDSAVYLGRPFPGCEVKLRKGQIWLTPPEGGDAVPTGDAGRQQGDEPLEFRGRIADRVTVRNRTVDTFRVEAALAEHPGIEEAVVTTDSGRVGRRVIAFVVPAGGTRAEVTSVRKWLSGQVPPRDIPDAVVTVRELPRNPAGKVDRSAFPLVAEPGAASTGDKGGLTAEDGRRLAGCGIWLLMSFLAGGFTDVWWPGSTDLTGVPGPWRGPFVLLYCFEFASFGLGTAFLVLGRGRMMRHGARRGLTSAAHLSLVWLLVSWWPQDNLYRLAAKNDWERQAALVYAFNVPLMIAAAIVSVWAVRRSAVTPSGRRS
jgi:acyl-coenzyme A synthetase/AMP-(fatty) acid ligase